MIQQTEKNNVSTGKIYFVGSGPGNPDLITVKGATLLSQAEVIITDRLAGDEIIERYANQDAVIIDVGKQGGNEKSYKQKDINALLIQFAGLYEKVVRLKGGDIAFFSNVYDELQTLTENNIAYEIVPGITAASGASAYTGVPLTARDHSRGVQLLTYYKNTIISNEKWKQLAAFEETLVFYMSSNNLSSIIQNLLNANADKSIPFIVVEQATTPNQKVKSFTLQSFINNPEEEFVSPSIVIIGKVTGLYKKFAWVENEQNSSSYFRTIEEHTNYLKIKSFIEEKIPSMLTEQKLQSFKSMIHGSSRDEIIWMSGFLAGLSEKNNVAIAPPAIIETAAIEKLVISVLYGTETGNSKKVSTKLATALKSKQHKVTIAALDQYNALNLAKENFVLIVISTQGDGEPPAAAKKFYDYLMTQQPDLSNLHYAVLALGDTSYPLFCKAGEDVDIRLNELSAKQVLPVEKLDTNFYAGSEAWINHVLNNLPTTSKALQPGIQKPSSKAGKHFYKGVVTKHINLNDKGSSKETFHIEIASNEGIYYLPGDSLGIIPLNTDEDVHEILNFLSADKNQTIEYRNETYTLFDLFKYKLNIFHLPLRIVEKYAALAKTELPLVRFDLKNILSLYPLQQNTSVEQLVNILESITPRLYSISSSPSAHGNNDVHITVSRNKFSVNEKTKFGFCSNHFVGLNEDAEVNFYIHPNDNFRLPAADKDVIMIGPGTGIAPFRSFIFHRDNEDAPGRNWLFFGDQHFATDFLYQTELLSFFDTGVLARINTAFSRDQSEKLYVQHRMMQQSKELFAWLENGAHIYICGCKDPMARDVAETLISIISQEANIDRTEATEYLQKLEENGRFSTDVY